MRAKTLLLVSLGVVLFGVGAYICFANNVDASPVVGKLAPDFELNSIEGKRIRLSDLRGTPVMLNFWATWCGYCVMEMPDMQAVFREMKTVPEEERVEILSINLLQSERNGLKDVKSFLEKTGYEFAVLLDEKSVVANAYRVSGIPMSFFVDRDGVIRYIHRGPLTKAMLWSAFERIK